MLGPHFVQARRLTRNNENLLAALHDRSKIINKRLEPTAKSFVMAKRIAENLGVFAAHDFSGMSKLKKYILAQAVMQFRPRQIRHWEIF